MYREATMKSVFSVGMDVHKETVRIAVLKGTGMFIVN
jgi:hypothetical protein